MYKNEMNKPIRILHVLGSLNHGGAQSYIMNIYRNIDRNKIQFDFVVHGSKKGVYINEINSYGGKIYVCPRYAAKSHFQYINWWKSFIKDKPYKFVHGHVRSTASIYLKIAKRNGVKTIAHSHSTSNGRGLSSVIKKIYQYKIRYIADYLFACSNEAGEWLFGKRKTKSKDFKIIKNAIDASNYTFDASKRDKIRTELNITNQFVVGTVGRIVEAKNPLFILEVFKEIKKIEPNSLLLWVGNGHLMNKVENFIEENNMEEFVELLGERNDVSDLLQAMDVFLFPSTWEGLGIAAIEAQASGLKTFVSNNIPIEVKVTNDIKFIDLKNNAMYWANKIIEESKKYRRRDNFELIKCANYDILTNAQKIQTFYLS